MEFKKEVLPATREELKEWALTIKVENDIESYTDGQMAIALGVLELIDELDDWEDTCLRM